MLAKGRTATLLLDDPTFAARGRGDARPYPTTLYTSIGEATFLSAGAPRDSNLHSTLFTTLPYTWAETHTPPGEARGSILEATFTASPARSSPVWITSPRWIPILTRILRSSGRVAFSSFILP